MNYPAIVRVVASVVFACLAELACPAREIVVEPQGAYVSVSQAVVDAWPGDTVTIREGIYQEEIELKGKKGTAAKPILIRADPDAPPGSVIVNGSRSALPEAWQRFISTRFGVNESHTVWSTSAGRV